MKEIVLRDKEKRKWQIALRRYILEKNPSARYAPYFGLDIDNLREWIMLQWSPGLNWDNFGSQWQFDFIMPLQYFDLEDEEDRRLCWNFINIRVRSTSMAEEQADVLAAKSYFQHLHLLTGYRLALKMVQKIEKIEKASVLAGKGQVEFLQSRRSRLEKIHDFTPYEFEKLNEGIAPDEILAERTFLNRFR